MTKASGKLEEHLSISQQIAEQQKLEGAAKEHFAPVTVPIVAKAHTPVYNMHRFFARRPFNVFEAMVKHYTNPGDIVLDPFMGGGVTVVESLRARRRVVGVDLNPMAWFIVNAEVRPIKLPPHIPVRCLLSFTLLLGNTIFEATIPLSVTLIMSQFGTLTNIRNQD